MTLFWDTPENANLQRLLKGACNFRGNLSSA